MEGVIAEVPPEIWYQIASELDGVDMLSLSLTCQHMRLLIQNTSHFESLWKRCSTRDAVYCEIGPKAIHRKDELGGSSAHRDSVLADGHCNPPSLGRCQNKRHYFRNTLDTQFPPLRPKSYVRFYLSYLRKQHTKRRAKKRELERKRQQHDQLCERLKQRPWLLNDLNKFYRTSLEKEDHMIRLGRMKRMYLERFQELRQQQS